MHSEILNIILFIVISHICVSFFCVYIGIQIGKSINTNIIDRKPNTKYSKNLDTEHNNISIDEKKIVLDIDTKTLTKKFDSLGETKTSSENISSSINKLKNMKG